MGGSSPGGAPAPRTSSLAIASLALSCSSFLGFGPFLSVPGVICGHLARAECRRDPSVKGDEMAVAGLIIGYVNLALCALGLLVALVIFAFFILFVLFAVSTASDAEAPGTHTPPPHRLEVGLLDLELAAPSPLLPAAAWAPRAPAGQGA